MEKIYLSEIARLFNNNLNTEQYIDSISTDTRKDCNDSLFFALKGELFDGHNFVQTAIDKGAAACIVEKKFFDIVQNNKKLNEFKNFIYVDDTTIALGELAKYYKSKFNILTIGITGSSGKTTTKNLLFSIFQKYKRTISTFKNFNNEIGLPLSIFNIDKNTEVGIYELGMNHLGEIRYLSNIVDLNSAVITTVFPAHLEGLGSLENVIKAKSEILESLKDNVAFLNGDNENVIKTLNFIDKKLNVIKFGLNNSDIKFSIVGNDCGYYKFRFDDKIIKLNIIGQHNLYNAIAAVTVAKYYNVPCELIKSAIENYTPESKRSELFIKNGITIYNDCYNSNPGSAESALKTINDLNIKNNVYIVFGDMRELGKDSPALHLKVSEFFKCIKKLKNIYLVGNEVKIIYDNIKIKNVDIYYFINTDESIMKICESLKSNLKEGDLLFIKGSRGIKLERVLENLKL